MRGKLLLVEYVLDFVGITPADAGKTHFPFKNLFMK